MTVVDILAAVRRDIDALRPHVDPRTHADLLGELATAESAPAGRERQTRAVTLARRIRAALEDLAGGRTRG